MPQDQILKAIPHRPPFLLLDEVVEQQESRIVCRKAFTGDEFWFAGHYPDFPITPGVLLCEAAVQAGAVLRADITKQAQEGEAPDRVPVATRANNVQFRQMVRPGDTIEIEVELTERLANAYYMKAKVTNATAGKLACRFDFACTIAPRE
ncbi:MAG: beta-hydroxyacyl-ACP dehydratase [Planctomycetales bacterium]|nr:beta-hydroxyacyl-ACP dehydratase [Planctomycetales bacterium]